MPLLGACASLAPHLADAEDMRAPQGDAQSFEVAGRHFTLDVSGGRCVVRGQDPASEVVLDLVPPCHVLTWLEAPPERAGPPSDGVSSGSVGSAMAWRYPSAGNEHVVAVVGDAVPGHIRATPDHDAIVARGWHCGGSLQALLFAGADLRAGSKREGIGLICVEQGVDERDFWLLAHPDA